MYETKAAIAPTDRLVTLNDRLNRALETFSYQCDRIEAVMARVNGTPQKIEGGKSCEKAPRPCLSLQTALDGVEGTVQRLIELTNSVERIA